MSKIPTKRCSSGEHCLNPDGPELPATEEHFYRNATHKDGLVSRCKYCRRAEQGCYQASWRASKKRERFTSIVNQLATVRA